jgi:AbrB family looped-hinge helix DNA binding protein
MGKTVGMSTVTLATNGQLFIPDHFREALRLRPGDKVTLTLEGEKLVVQRNETSRATLVEENGRKVLMAPPGAPLMTAEAVNTLLSGIP